MSIKFNGNRYFVDFIPFSNKDFLIYLTSIKVKHKCKGTGKGKRNVKR